jgi:FkbH-like protein
LDNTLWGGVLGEDGIEGIKLGGDYPGKAFHYWQEALLELSKTGVILTICSKNNEADVEALFAAREMPLKLEDFVSKRINWQDKATNIRAIAEELNIGLDSMVFVDDNPTERELIRQQLPMVAVPEFPAQPYGLADLYAQLVREYFSVYALTDEDRKKTEQYRQNASRKQLEAQFTDMTDFLRSLEMKLKIERVDAQSVSIPRVAQMTQKTNQFNLTTRRYTEDDIRSRMARGAEAWTLAVRDRFGDNGITGLMILVPENGWCIDTMLMSCRVLGKGIEEAFFKYVISQYSGALHAEYIPTAKNGQVADFYTRMGLCDCGNNQFEAQIEKLDTNVKDYYTIE